MGEAHRCAYDEHDTNGKQARPCSNRPAMRARERAAYRCRRPNRRNRSPAATSSRTTVTTLPSTRRVREAGRAGPLPAMPWATERNPPRNEVRAPRLLLPARWRLRLRPTAQVLAPTPGKDTTEPSARMIRTTAKNQTIPPWPGAAPTFSLCSSGRSPATRPWLRRGLSSSRRNRAGRG